LEESAEKNLLRKEILMRTKEEILEEFDEKVVLSLSADPAMRRKATRDHNRLKIEVMLDIRDQLARGMIRRRKKGIPI